MTLFLIIIHKISEISLYFNEGYYVIGRIDLTALQKYTITMRQLAYGITADMIDEYLKLGKLTVLECQSITVHTSLSVLGPSSYVIRLLLILSVY
jgi:hypothetical protein